jgi:methylaspartate mutase sigma subunit
LSETVTVVLGVIGADCHSVGNRILEHAFAAAGFKVVNLGVMVSQDEFVAAAVETDARAILVSSLYGHAEMDCRGLRGRCVEAGIGEVLLYLGGRLVVGKADFEPVRERFLEMGFDRVFPPETLPEDGIEALKADLRERGVLS